MHRRQVVTLEEILHQAFPVGIPFLVTLVNQAHVFDMHVLDHRFDGFYRFRLEKRAGLAIEIDEDKTVPDFAGEFG